MEETEKNSVRTRQDLAGWVVLFFFLVWAFFTHSHAVSANDCSRMAAIESLVERGTWVIDESSFHTVDRIFVNGHFYSDKPPVLTSIAAGVYAVLHEAFHVRLDASWCDLDRDSCHCRAFCADRLGAASHPGWGYYLLTLTLVGLPSALMLALFYRVIGFFELGNLAALLLTASLGLATQIFPYSTVFNSHVPAAACLLAGFYSLLRARDSHNVRRWLFAAGLLTALALTLELATGLFFAAFFAYTVWAHRQRAWPYLLGGLLPIALMVFLDYQLVGNPLPPYLYTAGYNYPGSRFPMTIAGNRSPDNVIVYGFRLLLGDHGLFALSPVLLWAVVALVQTWRERGRMEEGAPCLGWAAVLIGLASGLFALYYILFTDNFGGDAYGPRWFTAFIPLLFFFVVVTWSGTRAPAQCLFLALLVPSLVNSYQGALNPWREATPLVWLEHAPPGWRKPLDVALSGVVFEEIEPGLLSALATRRVDKRWFDARSCLVIPPAPTWLFIGPGTPLDPALAERSALSSGGELASRVDLRPARDAYLQQVVTLTWTSPVLAPSSSDPLTTVVLPADFGGQFALLGYELLSGETRTSEEAGEEIALVTAWRVEKRPGQSLALFIHLLDSQGQLAAQFDGLGATPDSLCPGDVLLHVHRLAIAPDARPGRYWLQLGLYHPDTMARLPLQGYASDRLLLTRIDVTD
jgi:4-amino-4-deoxy-L-arabinose transferase-like glycosyltransferase